MVKTGVALLSTLVLLVTGYGWANYSEFKAGLSTSDLIKGAEADGATDILLVGADSRTDAHGNPLPDEVLEQLQAGENAANLTDTMILLHIPKGGSGAVAFSFPRDTYTAIPGHGQHKINSAFGRGKAAAAEPMAAQPGANPGDIERRSSDAGRKTMLQTVEQLSGVSIDHYAEVNLLGFHQITKAVGGVPVCLNEPVSDSYSGAEFAAGHQMISGTDALAFVRQRHGLPRGDLDRVVRQQAFLAGLARSMLSAQILAQPAKLSGLIESVQQSLILDRGWDVMAFAERMEALANGAVSFQTIPIEDTDYDSPDGSAVKVDPIEVQREVRGVRDGRPPPAIGSNGGTPEASVEVLNGKGVSGLAQRVSQSLADDGFSVAGVGNTPDRPNSVVRYASGGRAAAEDMAETLGGIPAEPAGDLNGGEVQVVLGADYAGPGVGFGGKPRLQLDGVRPQQGSGQQEAITTSGVPCVN